MKEGGINSIKSVMRENNKRQRNIILLFHLSPFEIQPAALTDSKHVFRTHPFSIQISITSSLCVYFIFFLKANYISSSSYPGIHGQTVIYRRDLHSKISQAEKVSLEINLMAGAEIRRNVYVYQSTSIFLKRCEKETNARIYVTINRIHCQWKGKL